MIRRADVTLEQFLAAAFHTHEELLTRLWSLVAGQGFVEDGIADEDTEVMRYYYALHGVDLVSTRHAE